MQDQPRRDSILALAGGVGGAKMAQGLAGMVQGRLRIVVNTADDFELWGLRISPDIDTVIYTLAGIADPVHGWGIAGDTHETLAGIAALGENPWFSLGDRDFATHILRTQRMKAGQSLTDVTARLADALGVGPAVLPMSDEPVATIIHSGGQALAFQEYFVARRQADVVEAVSFDGIDSVKPGPDVLNAIDEAGVIVFCPSNPIVSIGPILQVPGIRDAIQRAKGWKVAVSPIIGGKALKGPADRMLASLGHEATALGVARLYAGLLDAFVIDEADEAFEDAIRGLGMDVLVTNTIMGDKADRERFAAEVLEFADRRSLV